MAPWRRPDSGVIDYSPIHISKTRPPKLGTILELLYATPQELRGAGGELLRQRPVHRDLVGQGGRRARPRPLRHRLGAGVWLKPFSYLPKRDYWNALEYCPRIRS